MIACLLNATGGAVAAGSTIEQVEAWPAAISKVTSDDINNVIAKYLDERRSVTGLLLPEGGCWCGSATARARC
ncbi:MAG: hypothetical protein WDN31_01530 [Hyphomicrobium sp.]